MSAHLLITGDAYALSAHRPFLAHVVLLRELAHHGRVSEDRIV